MDPLYQILGAAIGYLIGVLVRYLSRARFWRYVGKQAQQYIEDPNVPVSDPNEATEKALVEAQRPSIERIAKRVRANSKPPSITPITMKLPGPPKPPRGKP